MEKYKKKKMLRDMEDRIWRSRMCLIKGQEEANGRTKERQY